MRRLIRIEAHPNALSATHAGDFLLPVWEEEDGRETRWGAVYLHRDKLPPEVQLAGLALVDAEKRFGPILRAWIEGASR